MATTNQVLLDPKLLPSTDQTKEEEKNNPAFRNILRNGFLRETMNKKAGDIGWEDVIKIANLGYKHFDKNLDYKITIDDLRKFSSSLPFRQDLNKIEQASGKTKQDIGWEDTKKILPQKPRWEIQEGYKHADLNKDGKIGQQDLNKIEQALGKTKQDTGWEDRKKIVTQKPHRFWERHSYRWEIQEGYKHADLNKDGKIDQQDLNKIKQASGKTKQNTGWEDTKKIVPQKPHWETQEGYKHADFNKDGKIDKEDIFKLWANYNLPNLDLLKQAYLKTSQDIGWKDKTEIVKLGYKNADVNLDNIVNDLDKSIIFSAIYPDGTLVRSSADNRFMIVAGTKKRMPNEKTFNNLGLDKSQIITLEDAELKHIPDGNEIPLIKYDNGTLLKADNDYYLMAFGLRKKIPDELTLKNLDLNKSQATEISAKELENIPEGSPVPHFEYPIGTILKNAQTNEDKYYLITPEGTKKLIPNKTTLENLELDISKVKEVSTSKLTDIPNDPEPFPHLEFKNGSILKSGDKYYYTTMDKKIEVPDKMTLEAYGMDTKPHTITVRAKGTQSGGSYPLIQLRVDGQVAKEWFVTNEYKDYQITLPLSPGNHKIDVVYLNDQDINTQIHTWRTKSGKRWRRRYTYHQQTVHNVVADRNLYVDYIKIGNKRYSQKIEAEDFTRVKYDRAANQSLKEALDGQNVIAGQEHMNTAGALRFDVGIDSIINVSKEQLDKLDTVTRLNEVKYPNGTVIKDTDGKLWLMEQGIRRLIEDETTFEALGINKENIIQEAKYKGNGFISSEELTNIPQGDPIKIKYPNGTILEDSKGNQYIMQQGIRRLIPDKPTFETLGVKEEVKPLKIQEEELYAIPEGMPIPKVPFPNQTLVKGSGDSIYLIMGGLKKYVPGGLTLDNLSEQLGINRNNIKTISDTGLANIPTDDGVPKVDFYNSQTVKKNIFKSLLQVVAPFIPVIGQLYTIYQGFQAIKNKNYLQGALGFLGGLGQLSKFSSQFGKFGEIGKLAGNINKLNNLDSISNLVKLATTIKTINYASIALSGNDLTDGSGRKIRGVDRFTAALSQFGDVGNNLVQVYRIAAGLTGNRNIFGGKELTDEQRFNLVANAVAPYLGRAIGNIPKEGLGAFKAEAEQFISDLGTGLNLIAKSPIYAYNYIANAYQSNIRYKGYLVGDVAINDLSAKELADLMKRIETDNDKLNDSKLGELSGELAERFSNKEIGNRITQLERLDKILSEKGNGGLSESQKVLLDSLKGERDNRLEKALKNLDNALYPKMAAVEKIYPPDYARATEVLNEMIELGGSWIKDGDKLKITLPEGTKPEQSTTTLDQIQAKGILNSLNDDFLKLADMGISAVSLIPSPIRIVGDGYDVVTAIKGEGLAGKLSPTERLVILLPFIGSVHIKLVKGIARGFQDASQYHKITGGLQDIAKSLGKGDEIIGIRGSSIRGTSYHTGKPFGDGSDIDFFIVSDDLIEKFAKHGIKPVNGKILLDKERIKNLEKMPEFKNWVELSTKELGHETSIAIWKNEAFENIVKKEGNYILYNK